MIRRHVGDGLPDAGQAKPAAGSGASTDSRLPRPDAACPRGWGISVRSPRAHGIWTATTATSSYCPARICCIGGVNRNSGGQSPNAHPMKPPRIICTTCSNPPRAPSPDWKERSPDLVCSTRLSAWIPPGLFPSPMEDELSRREPRPPRRRGCSRCPGDRVTGTPTPSRTAAAVDARRSAIRHDDRTRARCYAPNEA